MGFVLMHPTGNANVRAILRGLLDQNLLAEFNTTIAVSPSSSFLRLIPETNFAKDRIFKCGET
jgi:hypothetical protein